MIATIISVSEEFTKNGDAYKKVTVTDGQGKETTKTVFNNLEDKWPLLIEGKTLEFKMEKRGQFWNVADITPIETPPPKKPEMLEEHQAEIDKAIERQIPDERIERIRSMALSYAKDLAIARMQLGEDVPLSKILSGAVIFTSYIVNGAKITKEE